MKKRFAAAMLVIIISISLWGGCSQMNSYVKDGKLSLMGLENAATVRRDEKGMAYISAGNLMDALRAHGFVTAQDRLFQMQLIRLFASGRICELVGEKGLPLDREMRTLGFQRNAKVHAAMLNDETGAYFQAYIDGINEYIHTRRDNWPLEFKLAGIQPESWSVADSLAIFYYMSWSSAANIKTEMVTQMLLEKLGPENTRELLPLNINPDAPAERADFQGFDPANRLPIMSLSSAEEPFVGDGSLLAVGSNNWAVSAERSVSGKPVVANDPHLDARILPGPWYPVGIFTPEVRVVGTGIPGIPGLVVLRNDYIAVGVTNAYADTQDLYVETVDPDDPERYLEGKRSYPFSKIYEDIRIKDESSPGGYRTESIRIRTTHRGPVVSEAIPAFKTGKVITLRWAPYEAMNDTIGLEKLMTARSATEVRDILSTVSLINLNFVFGDVDGNIGWVVSGKLPIRTKGSGTIPYPVTGGTDNWVGWVPFGEMPQSQNPSKGWVGTCNHYTVDPGFPYYYTSHASPSYRYRRLKELMASKETFSADDNWQFQRDTKNMQAAAIAPVMAEALLSNKETRDMGEILSAWDYFDDPDKAAPLIFQAVYREFALRVYGDELGDDLAGAMLRVWYFWQERLGRMVAAGDSPWFDDRKTDQQVETMADLFIAAAKDVKRELTKDLGSDLARWQWGDVHTITYVSPIRRSGFGSGLLGGGTHPFPGSGETLHRSIYDFSKPFSVKISAAMRMVADLGDKDKVMAVLPGGITARVFIPHTTDQVEDFMSGGKQYWWFSDHAIEEHTVNTLVLSP